MIWRAIFILRYCILFSGLILDLSSANERRRYKVTPSLIGCMGVSPWIHILHVYDCYVIMWIPFVETRFNIFIYTYKSVFLGAFSRRFDRFLGFVFVCASSWCFNNHCSKIRKRKVLSFQVVIIFIKNYMWHVTIELKEMAPYFEFRRIISYTYLDICIDIFRNQK